MRQEENKSMRKVNQTSYALIFKALLSEPQSFDTLVEITGLHRQTLYDLFRVLKKYKVVHVCGWDQDSMGRDMFPIFKLGAGRDKPRYRMPRSEIAKRYRLKKKALEEQIQLNNMLAGGSHVHKDSALASAA